MTKIRPANLTAQLHYQAEGNPPSTLPDSAISNSFPGLECDFRNVWRRIFVGIQLHEADNYVVAADPEHEDLVGHRLLYVDDQPLAVQAIGPVAPASPDGAIVSAGNPSGAWALEWSNALADALARHQGRTVSCWFTTGPEPSPVLPPSPDERHTLRRAELHVRPFFARSASGEVLPVIDEALLEPGELTQSLCSPWQNDYRECACYYWAASRPDYVNVEPNESGESVGNSWLSKEREPKGYVLDDRVDPRLVSYDDLFRDWQGLLRFIVGGNDYPDDPSEETA